MTYFDAPVPLGDLPLADVVAEDARAATVLDRFGLNYCCRGEETLAEAAERRGVPLGEVIGALEALGPPHASAELPVHADLDVLIAYIVSRHHAYVRNHVPVITAWITTLTTRHGARHPELEEIQRTFQALSADLLAHMAKEEHVLFPFVADLAVAARAGRPLPRGPFGTIFNPIRVMTQDHRAACGLIERLRALSGQYQPPADGCRTYPLCFAELARFDADLGRHIHLEDHVLFPRALDLERALT
jgi:regulator of cell morphogenesis and NO signaling